VALQQTGSACTTSIAKEHAFTFPHPLANLSYCHHVVSSADNPRSLAALLFSRSMSLHARSHSSQKRFSREGFKPLPNDNSQSTMAPNDATIDIPLQQVPSNGGGLRTQNSTSALNQTSSNTGSNVNEKQQHFARFRGRGRRHDANQKNQKVVGTGYDGEEDTLTTMGRVYNKILNCEYISDWRNVDLGISD